MAIKNLLTPVPKKIDPLTRRKNTRKNEDGIARKQKLSRYTIAIQSFFEQEKSFSSFNFYGFYSILNVKFGLI